MNHNFIHRGDNEVWIVTEDLEGAQRFDNYEDAKKRYEEIKNRTHEDLYLAEVKEWCEFN